MNEESEENDEENTKLVESLEVGFTVNFEPNPALDVYLQEQQKIMVKKLEEHAAKNEGLRTLTDKEIADYLRANNPFAVDKIYRALYKGEGPINSSDITPPPLPLKFMTRALTLGISGIQLNWSGGSDEGHLYIDLRNEDRKPIYGSTDEGITNFRTEIEEWVYDTMSYNGAGDGRSYGDIIRYNLKEGTVSTETWWTEEIHGGENFDTMETC